MSEKPLVSVVVITYNSEKFVIDTLNSVYQQTYQNIELVITDDCSTDKTNKVVKEWLQENESRFMRIVHLVVPRNTGIGKNCNRGLNACTGEWVKLIAGDDALCDDCIANYIIYVTENKNVEICYANFLQFRNSFDENNVIPLQNVSYNVLRDNEKSPKEKLRYIFFLNAIFAPSIFVKRDFMIKRGGFDETFPYCEDWPTWVAILSNGSNIYYMDIATIKYRLHVSSLNAKMGTSYLFPKYFEVEDYLYKKYIKSQAGCFVKYSVRYNYYLKKLFVTLHLDKRNKLNSILFFWLNTPFWFAQKCVNRK